MTHDLLEAERKYLANLLADYSTARMTGLLTEQARGSELYSLVHKPGQRALTWC